MLTRFLQTTLSLIVNCKRILATLFIVTLPLMLSGCIVAAIGAGAAGGVYFQKHYKITKTNKSVGIEKKEPQALADSGDGPPVSKPYLS